MHGKNSFLTRGLKPVRMKIEDGVLTVTVQRGKSGRLQSVFWSDAFVPITKKIRIEDELGALIRELKGLDVNPPNTIRDAYQQSFLEKFKNMPATFLNH